MGMEAAVGAIIQFTLIATIVGFAIENIKGVFNTPGHWDEIMLAIAVTVCAVYDIQLIEAIGGKVSVYKMGPWLDYAIGGSAMSGGGAQLLAKMKANVAEVQKAAE